MQEYGPSRRRVEFCVNPSRGTPGGPQHQGNDGARGDLGVKRQACRLQRLAAVQQQTHDVVRDGGNLQAFHRGLQAQLQFLATREFFQQLPVLHLGGDVHAGAQQCAGA